MFHITRTAKTFAVTAALLVLPVASASAQGAYGVMANVQTAGFPGAFSNYSNGLSLDTYEYRESDPAGAYMGVAPNVIWADAGARAWAQQGELRVATDAAASHLNAKSFPSSYPYGFGEVRFWDTVTVTSEVLPVGTPVTLVFRNELAVTINGSGNFAGTFYGTHTIAGRTVSLQQSFSNTDMDYTTALPSLTIETKVGNRFTMSGRAYLHTRAHYFATGPSYDGAATGELVLKPVLETASVDAYLVADSGVVYTPAGI